MTTPNIHEGALRAAEAVFNQGTIRYVSSPETPIANEFRQKKIKEAAAIIATELKLVEVIEASEESHALNVNVFSDAEPEMLSYYSEHRAVIAMGKKALSTLKGGG
jgi:hypothetical protein